MRQRIRTFKPELITDEELWDLEQATHLPLLRAFLGIISCADREGRFEWRPRTLKALVLPHWDGDFDRILQALEEGGYLIPYTVGGRDYGYVRTFKRHQRVDHREAKSEIPAPPSDFEPPIHLLRAPANDAPGLPGHAEEKPGGNGREGNGMEGNGRSARARDPQPPVIEASFVESVVPPRRVVYELGTFEPSPELRSEALVAGVKDLDGHLARLRSGPIGGTRGVLEHELPNYIRSFFGKWRTWEETDRAKAAGTRGAPAPEPPKAPTVPGCPRWVHGDHAKIAVTVGLDVRKAAAAFARGYHLPVDSLRPADLYDPFLRFLERNGDAPAEAAQ